MLVQITAYVVLDRLVLTAVAMRETAPRERYWSMHLQTAVPLDELDPEDGRDLLWLAARTVERALAGGSEPSPF